MSRNKGHKWLKAQMEPWSNDIRPTGYPRQVEASTPEGKGGEALSWTASKGGVKKQNCHQGKYEMLKFQQDTCARRSDPNPCHEAWGGMYLANLPHLGFCPKSEENQENVFTWPDNIALWKLLAFRRTWCTHSEKSKGPAARLWVSDSPCLGKWPDAPVTGEDPTWMGSRGNGGRKEIAVRETWLDMATKGLPKCSVTLLSWPSVTSLGWALGVGHVEELIGPTEKKMVSWRLRIWPTPAAKYVTLLIPQRHRHLLLGISTDGTLEPGKSSWFLLCGNGGHLLWGKGDPLKTMAITTIVLINTFGADETSKGRTLYWQCSCPSINQRNWQWVE